MAIQNAQQSTEMTPEPKVIQIEVPGNSALWYFEGGVKTAIETMETTKHYLENSGDSAGVERMNEALSSMTALLDVTRQVKTDLMTEANQRAIASVAAQHQQEHPNGVAADFAPRIEEATEAEDE